MATQITVEAERALRASHGVEHTVDTATAALLTGYAPQTLRRWACEGSGPVQPRRVNGRLKWVVSELRALIGETAAA